METLDTMVKQVRGLLQEMNALLVILNSGYAMDSKMNRPAYNTDSSDDMDDLLNFCHSLTQPTKD